MQASLYLLVLLALIGGVLCARPQRWWEREDVKLHIPDISCAGCTMGAFQAL